MMERMRERGHGLLALVAAIMLAATVLAGCTGCAGAGPVAKSVADQLLPTPRRTVWARCPSPDSYSDSYRDASGPPVDYLGDHGKEPGSTTWRRPPRTARASP